MFIFCEASFSLPSPSISSKAPDSHVQDMAQAFQKFLLDVLQNIEVEIYGGEEIEICFVISDDDEN